MRTNKLPESTIVAIAHRQDGLLTRYAERDEKNQTASKKRGRPARAAVAAAVAVVDEEIFDVADVAAVADVADEEIFEVVDEGADGGVRLNFRRIAIYEKTVSSSLNASLDSDDETARMMRGMPLVDVYAMAAEILTVASPHNISAEDLRAKYGHLNLGMQRMNLGNRVRKALRTAAAGGAG